MCFLISATYASPEKVLSSIESVTASPVTYEQIKSIETSAQQGDVHAQCQHAYTYNDRGELTADAMSRGGTYSYAYDNIGNREMSREGTAVPTAYETNELNQYISIGE